jgi:predicted permease
MVYVRHLLRDARFAVKLLVRKPGDAAILVFVLAIGIGANLAIMGLADALLSPPPGARNPETLVSVFTSARAGAYGPSSYLDFLDWQHSSKMLDDAAGHALVPLSYRKSDRARLIWGESVTGRYFDVFGVKPATGRFFDAGGNEQGQGAAVAVVSHAFWRTQLGSDPAVLGQTVRLNGHPFTIIGVAPAEFRGAVAGLGVDVWIPLLTQRLIAPAADRLESRRARWLQVKARLKPGASAQDARSELSVMMRNLAETYRETNENLTATVVAYPDATIHPDVNRTIRSIAMVLSAAAIAFLLLACTNVAQLLLVRSDSRRKELGIRIAIGASHRQIARQLLIEAMLLAVVGAAVAVLASRLALATLTFVLPDVALPLSLQFAVRTRTWVWALGLAGLATLLCGLGPALRAARLEPTALMNGIVPAPGRRRVPRLQSVLITSQVAISVMLLVGSALFLRSFLEMRKMLPALAERQLALVHFDTSLRGAHDSNATTVLERVVMDVARLPGVQSASLTDRVPLGVSGLLSAQTGSVLLPGQLAPAKGRQIRVDYAVIWPAYFDTMGIGLTEGRDFSLHDRTGTTPVVIVNESMAHTFWPNQSVVGQSFSLSGSEGPFLQIVGVAANSKYRTIGEGAVPFFYLPMTQRSRTNVHVVASTAGDPALLLSAMGGAIEAIDPDMATIQAATFSTHVEALAYLPKAASVLFAALGLVASVLAAIGTYGLLALFVDRHRRDIGIHIAIGARSGDVVRMVLQRIVAPGGLGLMFGALLAIVTSRGAAALLYGIVPSDPVALGSALIAATLAALLASAYPAFKAARINPVSTLKSE